MIDMYYDLDTDILYLLKDKNDSIFDRESMAFKSLIINKQWTFTDCETNRFLESPYNHVDIWFISHDRVNQSILDANNKYHKMVNSYRICKEVIDSIIKNNEIIEIKINGIKD